MSWLWVMALAVCLRAGYSIGMKWSTNTVRIHHATLSTLLLLGSAAGVVIISPFLGGFDFSGLGENWIKALAMMLSLGVGNVIYFKGQDMVDSGTAQVALASKLVWTALLAIPLLGATYSLGQIIGMAILAGAVLLVAKGLNSRIASTGALIIALSAVVFAVNSLTSADVANELSAPAYLAISYFGAAIVSVLAGYKYLKTDIKKCKKNARTYVAPLAYTSLVNLAYFTSIYFAFRVADEDRDLVAILTNAQVVTTVVLASIVLREKENIFRKTIAGLLVLVAAYLISGV